MLNGRKEVHFRDHHDNMVELVSFDAGTDHIEVVCEGVVETCDTKGVAGKHTAPLPLWYYQKPTDLTQSSPSLNTLLKELSGSDPLEQLHQLSDVVRQQVRYEKDKSHPHWSAETVLQEGVGVCQDHAHVFIAAARQLGLPARYVSGYLKLDNTTEQQAMHAWAEAWVEGLGWLGFDVSNAICPDERYIKVATGADYIEAAPVRGAQIGGDGESLEVEIFVTQQQ